MVTKPNDTATDIVIMSADELREAIDVEARERLGMSGDVFIEKWSHKELPDSEAAADIGILVRLLNFETSKAR